jgi:hypothetical protein
MFSQGDRMNEVVMGGTHGPAYADWDQINISQMHIDVM